MPLKQLPPAKIKLIARNIARLRDRCGITQERIAEEAGISYRYFQNIEAGDNAPTLAVLFSLKASLKCSWEELLGP